MQSRIWGHEVRRSSWQSFACPSSSQKLGKDARRSMVGGVGEFLGEDVHLKGRMVS